MRIATGVVATLAAMVLGLLLASAKNTFDNEKGGVTQMATKIVFLDRALAAYVPEAANTRALVRRSAESAVVRMWPAGALLQPARLLPDASPAEAVFGSILSLSPKGDTQTVLKSQAVQTAIELGQMRWLLFEQAAPSISPPLLIIVVFWFAVTFASAGLFAPFNATVICAVLMAALSVSGAFFLIVEMDMPFGGVIEISSEPMRNAMNHLGR